MTHSLLHDRARALIAAMQTGDKQLEMEAYDAFRRTAMATADAGHPETAIAVIRHVIHMRPWGHPGPIGGNLPIPHAAGLTS